MWIGEAGLYHYKARAYLPALGRFAQSDPILYAGGMNLYASPMIRSISSTRWGYRMGRRTGDDGTTVITGDPLPGERAHGRQRAR